MVFFETILFVSLFVGGLSLQDCNKALEDFSTFSGECNNKWSNLKPLVKPTQPQVGYAWIQYKLDTKFTSQSEAQSTMDASPTPAIIGPGPAYYIIDDHHTLCALDFSGYEDVSVTLNVLCDKRNMSAEVFWTEMSQHNSAYLAAHPLDEPNLLPVPISFRQLPTTFSFTSKNMSLSDDPWRSLAGFSRKVEDVPSSGTTCDKDKGDDANCERCMYRGCKDGYQTSGGGVSFFEFRWSYFMNDATFYNTQLWDNINDYTSFISLYSKLPASVIGDVKTSDWFDVAVLSIPLCRGKSGANYKLSPTVFPPSSSSSTGNSLPGYIQGYEKLATDPSCDAPTCEL